MSEPVPKRQRRVYIEVSGGVLTNVWGAANWVLIDWDNINEAPMACWDAMDLATRRYIRDNYPEDFAKFFGDLASGKK